MRTILIVDDLPDMRLVLRMTLERVGWEVIEAVDGQEAIEVTLASMPDVVLMDYNMPRKDGIQACREITQDAATAKIPVLIYTGALDSGLKQAAIDAGAADFMSKPLLPPMIRERVEQVYNQQVYP
jgi:CheY-like chemotaxis protein